MPFTPWKYLKEKVFLKFHHRSQTLPIHPLYRPTSSSARRVCTTQNKKKKKEDGQSYKILSVSFNLGHDHKSAGANRMLEIIDGGIHSYVVNKPTTLYLAVGIPGPPKPSHKLSYALLTLLFLSFFESVCVLVLTACVGHTNIVVYCTVLTGCLLDSKF